MTNALVTVEWLNAHLAAPDIRILDASFYLPPNPPDAQALFASGHIPGARFFDINTVADMETDLPHMLPTAGRFARQVAALGIGADHHVVVYDQAGIFSAPRGWWMFRVFGHDRVSVLDGGLPAWRAAGYALQTGAPTPVAATFQPALRAGMVRGLGDMLANVASGAEQVLDARAPGRFDGSAPEPRPGLPSGHIPGAINVPASTLLAAGHMKPPETLRALFAERGVDGSKPVITSCGSGVSAAIITLGLHLAGLPEGALYDGSWTEWASLPETPKAVGVCVGDLCVGDRVTAAAAVIAGV